MWIEILLRGVTQECIKCVTPLAGVWIEIPTSGRYATSGEVTPLAGVWIEIK